MVAVVVKYGARHSLHAMRNGVVPPCLCWHDLQVSGHSTNVHALSRRQ